MNQSVPIYRQLMDNIKQKIVNGELKVGDRLPSERDMAEKYGINRMTVRNAIKKMEAEGTLISKRGSGTYVSAQPSIESKLEMANTGHLSLSAQIRQKGMKSTRKTLLLRKLHPSGEIQDCFPNESYVYEITRLSLINDEPYALQIVNIPFSKFTGFESNEPEEEELPLLEQIQKQTDDELKLSLAKKLAELERLLGEIRIYRETLASRNIKSPKRTTVSDDQLFIQVGDHLEILPWYLENELLPVINLSSNSFDNVKVSGIDFTGTNANLDPQTVYNKDMSHGIYDGLNFTMKSFDGVNTDDASFEGCVMDFAKNTPQVRKKSDNSFQKKI